MKLSKFLKENNCYNEFVKSFDKKYERINDWKETTNEKIISYCFLWSKTKQGKSFWVDIYAKAEGIKFENDMLWLLDEPTNKQVKRSTTMNISTNGVTITLTQEQLEQIAEQTTKKPVVFSPKADEIYWCVDLDGSIMEYHWNDCRTGKNILAYGNIYKTKEEAEKAKDIQFAKVRLRNAIAEANQGWKPDWNNGNLAKFYFVFDKTEEQPYVGYIFAGKTRPDWMYMESYDIAENILKQYEDDIKLILSE